ncbi:MAG: NAD-dependent epimerase/dehydratase family protein [Melioribacteraceae bacterium]|nr:NAD-dependent epimerase/dehydratase family protein [Melioribacteraceae bacterium]
MKFHLVSGACGFVGRNTVKQLLKRTKDNIIMVDDLSVGTHPSKWLHDFSSKKNKDAEIIGKEERLFYWKMDFRKFLQKLFDEPDWFKNDYGLNVELGDAFHFAAIVGGRAKIEGDPMAVALDLSIDAEFFNWIAKAKPEHVLYPSSSAAYPINMQTESDAVALKESDINIDGFTLGMPDLTYGWTKMTGEFLAKIAARHYGISIVCIRPFSGYGEDQDLSYPVPAIARRAARKEDPFEVWGSGKQGRDFVHIDDVMDCMFTAMDKIHDGTAINIGSGKLTSFIDLIKLFSSFASYNPTIKPLIDKPVGVHSRYCDMSFVKERIGWEPKISLEEGMKRVYDVAVKKLKHEIS